MKEMDKLECLVQCTDYEQELYGEKDLGEFQGLTKKIHSPEGRKWLSLNSEERRMHVIRRSERRPVIFVTGRSILTLLEPVAYFIR